MTFTNRINSGNPTMSIDLPMDLGHFHTITLTSNEVTTLRAGGTVTGKVSSSTGHTHTYTISCA